MDNTIQTIITLKSISRNSCHLKKQYSISRLVLNML